MNGSEKQLRRFFIESGDHEGVDIIDMFMDLAAHVKDHSFTGSCSYTRKLGEMGIINDYINLRNNIPGLETLARHVFSSLNPESARAGRLALIGMILSLNPVYLGSFTDWFYRSIAEGDSEALVTLLNLSGSRFPSFNSGLPIQYGTERLEDIVENIEKIRSEGVPSMMINTLPKTGSMYVAAKLSKGLNLTVVPLSVQRTSLAEHVVETWAKHFSKGGCISQEHIDPTAENIRRLKENGVNRIVVNLRDPRQALLSMVHHVYERFDEIRHVIEPVYPDSYLTMSFNERMDWMIGHYFPEMMNWIEGWVNVSDRNDPDFIVHLTTYEEMHDSESEYFRKILEFYGIDESRLAAFPQIRKDGKTHFRCGKKDEWRDVFSRRNKEDVQQMIPGRLAERFGWT
jgi:hypothetical protein